MALTNSGSSMVRGVLCFAEGTRIATPRGEAPVEALRVGDRAVTRDNGLQAIRWISRRRLDWRDFAVAPHLRPILIRQGSLGGGLPERDMMVSPNHRLLVATERTMLHFDEREVLVAAKHLMDHRLILQVQSAGTTYFHLLFDRHEVVLANGAWAESFQPDDRSLQHMDNPQRQEILEIFPDFETRIGRAQYDAARRVLTGPEVALLAR
jgi:hypothetical protein